MSEHAEVVRSSFLSLQVCVPKTWTDQQATEFAEKDTPCGTQNGWQMRKQGDPNLAGCDERVQCTQHADNVHIMLDA